MAKNILWAVLVSSLVCVSLAGETCSFIDGDATVSVFCDDGCCDSQCCGDSDVDESAIAIALSAVIGLLLLILFIALLIYCLYHQKKEKIDDDEDNRRPRSSTITPSNMRNSDHLILRNNFSQTGDPLNPNKKEFVPSHRDKAIIGHPARWTNFNPYPTVPRPAKPGMVSDDKQVQTVKFKVSTVSNAEMGSALFRGQQWAQGPEPHVTVPAPFWRYHKKGPTESKDVYSLLEKQARTDRKSRVEQSTLDIQEYSRDDAAAPPRPDRRSRVEHPHLDVPGGYRDEEESNVDDSAGSRRNTGSLSD